MVKRLFNQRRHWRPMGVFVGLLILSVYFLVPAEAQAQFCRLQGAVYEDANWNGFRDAGERPLAGIPVVITSNAGKTTNLTTDANGNYAPNNLVPGTYSVTVNPPACYTATSQTSRGNFSLNASNENVSGIDFGLVKNQSCGQAAATATPVWTNNNQGNNAEGPWEGADNSGPWDTADNSGTWNNSNNAEGPWSDADARGPWDNADAQGPWANNNQQGVWTGANPVNNLPSGPWPDADASGPWDQTQTNSSTSAAVPTPQVIVQTEVVVVREVEVQIVEVPVYIQQPVYVQQPVYAQQPAGVDWEWGYMCRADQVPYLVQPGDQLGVIAERFGTTSVAIAQANELSNRDFIYVDQTLCVPNGIGLRPPSAGAPVPAPAATYAASPVGGTVVVQTGDTLGLIAERNGVSMADLMAVNGISDADYIFVGQVLVLPSGNRGTTQVVPSAPAAITRTYVVQSGDSLSAIAQRHGTDVETLMVMNGMTNADYVFVGQTLLVP